MRTNQQIIDLWRQLVPSIEKEGLKIRIKGHKGQTIDIKLANNNIQSKGNNFSKNNQYR